MVQAACPPKGTGWRLHGGRAYRSSGATSPLPAPSLDGALGAIGILWPEMPFLLLGRTRILKNTSSLKYLGIAKQYLETEFLTLEALEGSAEINGSNRIH